jgi:hypothetical protein
MELETTAGLVQQHLSVSFFEEKKPNAKLQTVMGNFKIRLNDRHGS